MKWVDFAARLGLLLGLLGSFAAGARSAELIFEDNLGTGDLWSWNHFVGGSPAVGD